MVLIAIWILSLIKNDILTLKKKAKEFSVFGKTNFSEE